MTSAMDDLDPAPSGLLVADEPPRDPWDELPDDDFGDDRFLDPDGEGPPPFDPEERERRERFIRRVTDGVVLVAVVLFVFGNLHPADILSGSVPAGGDMGAHVWGPAFLRDHLLTHGRLSGWTPDWYAGFPAYTFYMVVPSLLIVALDVGLFGGWLMILPIAAAAAIGYKAWQAGVGWRRRGLVALAAIVGVLGVDLPYGTAFKLVTVLGVLSLPFAVYAFGRLAELPFPGPALLAVASTLYLFDRNFTIYGGNIASTLAGEFCFSIALSLAVVYLGFVLRGLRTGRYRATAAVLLALTGLCHLIPAFFALAGTLVALLLRPRLASLKWLATVLPVGGLISAFWVLPFYWQKTYVNDMGWEKLPYATAENGMRSWSKTLFRFDGETYWKYLIPRNSPASVHLPDDLRWVLALAVMAVVLCIAFRIRAGIFLAVLTLTMGAAFVLLPNDRLWNARLLPFYYLGLYLLAAIGISEICRTLSVLLARDPEHPGIGGVVTTTGCMLLAAFVLVGLPLRSLPGGHLNADGSYSWLNLRNGINEGSFVRSWAKWNYSGYVGKGAYGEYRDVVETMQKVGEEHGCGRSMWEYDKDTLNSYGTPMSLMLLPHWTDGCIGSMEGLFFEASGTTPFHFLNQSELSAAPSSAQRDLPYSGFDIEDGVRHLQLMGVRYYMATTAQAIEAARGSDQLEEIATSGPWVVFQVADSPLVEPLANEPAVLDGITDVQHDWICRTRTADGKCDGPAIRWYMHPEDWDVYLASSGPSSWQRVDPDDPQPEVRSEPTTNVSNIEADTDSISFDVDEVGHPVLVKASYFPNWTAHGAEGPYRVAPNLMVVVPTDTHVELTYGRAPVEIVGMALTAVGIGLAVLLAIRPPIAGLAPREDDEDGEDDIADPEPAAGDGDPPSIPDPPLVSDSS